jgi:hypothetical protein
MNRCILSRNFKNEEAMANFGPQCHRKKINSYNIQGVSGGIVNILGGGSMDYSQYLSPHPLKIGHIFV